MIPHFLRFWYSDYLTWRETTAIKKQTNGARSISHLFSQLRYLPGNQKLTQKILTHYFLKMWKNKRGIPKCQREHDWVKLNRILHSTKFKEQVCFKFVFICTKVWCSRSISCYVEMKILSAKEDSFTNLKFKVQSEQRRIKLPKIPWLDALKLPRNTGENKLVVEKKCCSSIRNRWQEARCVVSYGFNQGLNRI